MIDPTSIINIPVINLRNMLINSPNFREWTNTYDSVTAGTRVFIEAARAGEITRPFAIVSTCTAWSASTIGTGYTWRDNGSIQVLFEAQCSAGLDDADEHIEFTNALGGVIEDLLDMSGNSSDYLNINQISYMSPPTKGSYDEEEVGDNYYNVILRIDWGI